MIINIHINHVAFVLNDKTSNDINILNFYTFYL